MKAQITIEFLLIFSISIMFFAIIADTLIAENNAAFSKFGDFEKISKSESAARAIEAALNCGSEIEFDFYRENISYSVREDNLYVNYKGKIIEINGVFADDTSTPV